MVVATKKNSNSKFSLTIAIAAIAINMVLGAIVRKLGLPVYLDTVGTFCAVILLGWKWGLVVSACSIGIMSVGVWGGYFYYSFTAVGIVITIELCRYKNLFKSKLSSAFSGFLVAIVAAILSAPVTAFVFGGVTATGNDVMTVFWNSFVHNVVKSVFLSGISSEPVDKILTALIAYKALKMLSPLYARRFSLRSISD